MNNLRLLRNERGYTQKQLASILHIAPSAISMYENGQRTPEFAMLKKMADHFNVSIDYLSADAIADTKQDHSVRNPAQFEKFLRSAEIEFDGEFYRLSDEDRESVRLAMKVAFNQIKAKAMKERIEKEKQQHYKAMQEWLEKEKHQE